MNREMHQHDFFEQLVAGYALDALEPADEQTLTAHLRSCSDCAAMLADLRRTAAELSLLAEPVEPPVGLGAAIRAAALAEGGQSVSRPQPSSAASGSSSESSPGSSSATGRVLPMAAHRDRRTHRPGRLLLAVAAAAVLLAGGASLGLVARGPSKPNLSAACTAAAGCHRITLTDAASKLPAAVVMVRGGSVYLLPSRLAPDNRASQIYVLWQVTGAHTPLPVGSFDVGAGKQSPIALGSLAAPYRDTWAFAISLEPGRTIPAAPSSPIALGTVAT